MTASERFGRLPTAAKLLVILSAVLLPIGIALTVLAQKGIHQADATLQARSHDQARAAAGAVESLIARNALALRVAAAEALRLRAADPCEATAQALTTAPAITRLFSLRMVNGDLICSYGGFRPKQNMPLVAPGDIRVWMDSDMQEVVVRVGVIGGMATASLPLAEVRGAAVAQSEGIRYLALRDLDGVSTVIGTDSRPQDELAFLEWPVGNGPLSVRVGVARQRITTEDQLVLLLPVLMWVAAALMTWLLVGRLVVRPLKRLERAVTKYQPGDGPIELPRKLGPSTEIEELRDAFARAIGRAEESERETTEALEGQRRLVREVHHRVKNNLQVVASLLNIHGRSAGGTEAQAAYAGISRRVGALSIVHRNHFAEMEENRGIALRPLVTELATELRAGAPDSARGLAIDLDLDTLYTTQDAAVAVSFLITEIVEFAMLNAPKEPVEISLRRNSELTAQLTLSSQVLNPDDAEDPGKLQFERIVAGLAKQLRSNLERKLGRYGVDLPVFPQR